MLVCDFQIGNSARLNTKAWPIANASGLAESGEHMFVIFKLAIVQHSYLNHRLPDAPHRCGAGYLGH